MTYQPGMYKSDDFDAYRKKLIAEEIRFKVNDLVEFTDAVVMENTDQFDFHMRFPKDHTLPAFKISEGSTVPPQKVGTFTKSFSMDMYREKLLIDDLAKVRLDQDVQWSYSMDAVARGMAQAEDNEILTTLYNGVGIEDAAGTAWNNDAADPRGDVASLIEAIFDDDNTNISEKELSQIVVYYPRKLVGRLNLPEMWQNGTSGNQGRMSFDSPLDWMSGKLNWTFRSSQKLNALGEALAIIKGPQTARHYRYTGDKIPSVAQTRDEDEGADAWFITSAYKTVTIPSSYSKQTTNERIMKITNVLS